MSGHTHGKCLHCKVVFRWLGKPLLRSALCPRCQQQLARTAARLVTRMQVIDGEHPLMIAHATEEQP